MRGLPIPFGLGVKADINHQWMVGLEWGMRPVFSDMLDGVSQSGNPDQNDWYGMGGMNLSFRFGRGDSDGDGVRDAKDKCPDLPADASTHGCPDEDFDDVPDHLDQCPSTPGIKQFAGCPDSDGDLVPDDVDLCPDEIGHVEYQGCKYLDSDLDGLPDHEDDCPDLPGPVTNLGCPDTDGDGILDNEDQCPEISGPAATNGCPDRDRDGVIDPDDECPDDPGDPELNGCRDQDGDGIIDSEDNCPELGGQVDSSGCPEISQEDEAILTLASESVFFETGQDQLKPVSFGTLDQIADILQKYSNYNLRIEGYTDNRGNDAVNQQLSERRARRCFDYLVQQGIAPDRMFVFGYGENKPIANNNSVEGRAKNRRVEFHPQKRY